MTADSRTRRTRLVLVHGSRLSATQWSPQTARLAADTALGDWLDVVVPDLPGHGARSAEPFTLDRAVGAVAAAVEANADPPVERVVLAGHSLGGYVAATYAATYPVGWTAWSSSARPPDPGEPAPRYTEGWPSSPNAPDPTG